MGGAAAALAAALRPDRIAALVLIGPVVRSIPAGRLTTLGQHMATSGPWAPMAWAAYLPRLYPGRLPEDFASHRARIVQSMRRPAHRRAFHKTTLARHTASEERLAEVQSATLVVMGERDADFRDPGAEAQWVSQQLHAETLMVPEAGHYPHVEYPDLVNPVVVDFLRRAFASA
jgi:pimeloyl-ACP methyl ester carboxylesterase